jgi:hypothetical protein
VLMADGTARAKAVRTGKSWMWRWCSSRSGGQSCSRPAHLAKPAKVTEFRGKLESVIRGRRPCAGNTKSWHHHWRRSTVQVELRTTRNGAARLNRCLLTGPAPVPREQQFAWQQPGPVTVKSEPAGYFAGAGLVCRGHLPVPATSV